MVVDAHHDRIARHDAVERLRLAAGLRQVQVRNEGIAAERVAGEQEVHVLQMAVEARRYVDAVEDAEAVPKRQQRLDQGRDERAGAVAPGERSGLLTEIVLN